MNEFHLPHVEDLTTNAKLPGQLTENFKASEQAINDLLTRIEKLEKKDKQDDEFMKNLYD